MGVCSFIINSLSFSLCDSHNAGAQQTACAASTMTSLATRKAYSFTENKIHSSIPFSDRCLLKIYKWTGTSWCSRSVLTRFWILCYDFCIIMIQLCSFLIVQPLICDNRSLSSFGYLMTKNSLLDPNNLTNVITL